MGTHPIFESDFDCLTECYDSVVGYSHGDAHSKCVRMWTSLVVCLTHMSNASVTFTMSYKWRVMPLMKKSNTVTATWSKFSIPTRQMETRRFFSKFKLPLKHSQIRPNEKRI